MSTEKVFPIFAAAFAVIYVLAVQYNWALFTYHPKINEWQWLAQPAKNGPPMYWYGWLVLSTGAALVVGSAATLVPRERLQQATFFCCTLAVLWPILLGFRASSQTRRHSTSSGPHLPGGQASRQSREPQLSPILRGQGGRNECGPAGS